MEDGRVVRDRATIAREITNFYNSLYKENLPCYLFIEGLDWHPLEYLKATWLERPFEEEEIQKAIWSLDIKKAPVLNGFSLVGFHQNDAIGRSMNSTFISLIPMKD